MILQLLSYGFQLVFYLSYEKKEADTETVK